MLLNFRIQEKTSTIVFQTANGEVYTWKPGECDTDEKKQTLFADIGRTVLEVLNDPDQPVTEERPGQHVRQGQGGAGAPGAGMDDLVNEARARFPLLNGLLKFAEDISSDDPEAGG